MTSVMATAKRISVAKALAIVILVVAASSNEFVLARLLISDVSNPHRWSAIRLHQAMLANRRDVGEVLLQ